jgi:hypothetical protein
LSGGADNDEAGRAKQLGNDYAGMFFTADNLQQAWGVVSMNAAVLVTVTGSLISNCSNGMARWSSCAQ